MENNTAEYADITKTPRRTRKSSLREVNPSSQHKRSTRKTDLPEIEETEKVLDSTAPKTPSRSVRVLDFQTPSRKVDLAEAQTPRRSVRKSIKPIQEYENIVAQKGLSLKRAASSSIEEVEAPGDGKWMPAVIGRVSTKRGKKAKRAKNKQLQRQERVMEDEQNTERNEEVNRNQLCISNKKGGDDVKNENNKETKYGEVSLHVDQETYDKFVDKNQPYNGDLDVEKKLHDEEKVEEHETSLEEKTTKQDIENKNDDKEQKEVMENKEESKILSSEVHKDEDVEEVSDSSIEGGDIEMTTMPVTADDMEGPEKPFQSSPADEDSNNKADDSDCIMLSLNESSNTEQFNSGAQGTKPIDDSCDSTGNNMPSLLICSDDEDDEKEVKDATNKFEKVNTVEVKLAENEPNDRKEGGRSLPINSTFNADKSPTKNANDQADQEKSSLSSNDQCSPLNSTFDTKISPIKHTTEQTEQQKSSLQDNDQSSPLNSTFDADKSPTKNTDESIRPETPVLRASITRLPTPFKSNKAIVPDIIVEPEEETDSVDIPDVLIIQHAEIERKSSRKRSFSICTDRPKKVVTFHSPANVTVSIYDGDLIENPIKEDANNITLRRKRSLSVTETDKEVKAYFKQKNTAGETPDKRRKLPQPSSRTKIPNFAAIHQQQFQRMESISDHVARKAERAKILTNSATKVKPASIQKGLPVKNSVLRDANKDVPGNKVVPKARQRIELSAIEHKPKVNITTSLRDGIKFRSKSKPDLSTLDDFPSIGNISKLSTSTITLTGNTKPKLPKPRFNLTLNTLKAPIIFGESNQVKVTSTAAAGTTTTIATVSRIQSNLPDPRSKLGTEKLADRRKRLMDMYKSRGVSRTGEKNREILKGVRTNRRFELQMMCRNRPN